VTFQIKQLCDFDSRPGTRSDTNMFSTSLLHPLEYAKWFFFLLYVASTIAVTVGVYWENERFPKAKQELGWRLLILALAFDTFFTILIFGTDAWINQIQQREIIALETRLAARTLSDEQMQRITDSLEQYKGQEFKIVTYWDMKEPVALANQIYASLDRAGWNYIKLQSPQFMLGGTEGVQVWRHPDADDRVQKAADALVAALNDTGAAAVLKLENPTNNPVHNTITLNVGTKP
jgi:hypothetical protein